MEGRKGGGHEARKGGGSKGDMFRPGGEEGTKEVGGGQASKMQGEGTGKLSEMNGDGKDVKQNREWGDRRGPKDTGDALQGIVLGYDHLCHDSFGMAVIEPDCGAIGEDREDDAQVCLTPVGIVQATHRVTQNVKGADCGASPVGYDGGVWHPGEQLMKEDSKIAHGDGWTDSEVSIRVRWVAEGEHGNQVTKAAVASFVTECDELGLIRVDAQATTGHPVNHNVKMRSDEVHRVLMVAGDSEQSSVVHVELCAAIQPTFCQTKEGSGIDGRQDG
jgi:hypothetical protein